MLQCRVWVTECSPTPSILVCRLHFNDRLGSEINQGDTVIRNIVCFRAYGVHAAVSSASEAATHESLSKLMQRQREFQPQGTPLSCNPGLLQFRQFAINQKPKPKNPKPKNPKPQTQKPKTLEPLCENALS